MLSAFDIETTGIQAYKGHKTFSYATCTEKGETFVQRLDRKNPIEAKHKLQKYLLDSDIIKICHNFHFEKSMLLSEGYAISTCTQWHCTLLMAQIIHNLLPGYSLDKVYNRFEKDYTVRAYYTDIDNQIAKARKIYPTYKEIPEYLMTPYQKNDVERTMFAYLCLWPLLNHNDKMVQEYYMEIDLVHATIELENRGIMLARIECEKLLTWLKNELASNQKQCVETLGEFINFGSHPAVSKLLFEKLKFPILSYTKGDLPATDKDAFEELRQHCKNAKDHKVLDMILRHRSYTKGIANVLSYVNSAGKDEIIHPNVNTNRAVTGRESITNPPLQTIQKAVSLRTKYSVPSRKCFRARPGFFFVLKDYAGIEMRLAVQCTNSPRLIKLLEQDFDFHDACAKSFYMELYTDKNSCVNFFLNGDEERTFQFKNLCNKIGKDEAELQTFKTAKKMLRSAAKNGRFAMLYGAGLQQVSTTLNLPFELTKIGYRKDKEEYPEFYTLMDECTSFASRHGFIETIFGRQLRVNPKECYAATDYKIQGSAGGLFKRAQIALIRKQRFTNVFFILPVHDEFIFEYPRSKYSEIKIWSEETDKLITTFPEITVKLSTETKLSTYTWHDAKELK